MTDAPAASRPIRHRALRAAPGGSPLERARLTDQERLAIVLEGVALIGHLNHVGWTVGDGTAARAWDSAAVDGRGHLAVEDVRPGRAAALPQTLALALLLRVFGVETRSEDGRPRDVAGRGAARRAARDLGKQWRQELAPAPLDRLTEEILEAAPFLWQPAFADARRALVAEHGIEDGGRSGAGQPWIVGPGGARRRLLAGGADAATAAERLAGPTGRDLWDGIDGSEDPVALSAAGRWHRAALAWTRRRVRDREDALAHARAWLAAGRAASALDALGRRRGASARLLRARCQHQLGELRGARRSLGQVEIDELTDDERVDLASLSVRLAAGRGDRDALRAWIARLVADDDPRTRVLSLLVAAEAAWDAGERAAMADYLELARGALDEPERAGRWHHVEGLRRLAHGDGPGAVEHLGQALARRRGLARPIAGRLWNDVAVARVAADDLPGAERAIRHALRLLEACDGPARTTLALYNLAEVRVRRGRFAGVEDVLERSTAENRRAANRRGTLHDLELWARFDLARGRLAAALVHCAEARRCASALDEPTRLDVVEVFAARALGWLGRVDEAAAALDAGGAEALESLEPEEHPAIWAHAGRAETARSVAHGTTLEALWRDVMDGRPPSLDAWQSVDRLEPWRAARLVVDVELLLAGATPINRLRRALGTLHRAGASPLVDRLEGRSTGSWRALGRYLDRSDERGTVPAIRELFARAGYDDARLILSRGAETPAEHVLVDGPGGVERLAAGVDGGELRLETEGRDAQTEALLRLIADDLVPRTPQGGSRNGASAADSLAAGPPTVGGSPTAARVRDHGMLGDSETLAHAVDRLDRLSSGDLPVLVLGESGTGKELAARRVHAVSRRAAAPFLAVNCAALSESLIQSDLFGHVRGSFTGAERDRAGVFEAARGGTVFLDEIGDLPLGSQGKLLRVLQEREIRRVGESMSRNVDVRVVAATHRDLESMVEAGEFRQDLFFRLKVARVVLPPLRERGRDVLLLAGHFLNRIPGRRLRLSNEVRDRLLAHTWPGNVRELRNLLEVAAALSDGEEIVDIDLPASAPAPSAEAPRGDYHQQVDAFRRRVLGRALEASGGNRAEAARQLGMSRQALSYLVRQLDLA
ncbi:MAG: sigma 54-interacting transcriptional regulator [Acidobacteriota bacterium]